MREAAYQGSPGAWAVPRLIPGGPVQDTGRCTAKVSHVLVFKWIAIKERGRLVFKWVAQKVWVVKVVVVKVESTEVQRYAAHGGASR